MSIMHKVILVGFFLFFTQSFFSQTPNWVWHKEIPGALPKVGFAGPQDEGWSTVADTASGYFYVSGFYSDSVIYFGSFSLVNDTTSGSYDIFIAKCDSAGQVIWAKNFGGVNTEQVFDLSLDLKGNIFMSGTFDSPQFVFGQDTLESDSSCIFFAKMDSNGNPLWARGPTGQSCGGFNSVANDKNGNLYVAGTFASPKIVFGGNIFYCNPFQFVPYIAKYDSLGNFLWANAAGPGDYCGLYDMAVDEAGNAYIIGRYSYGSVYFPPFTLLNTSGNVFADIFVVKYGSLGNIIWAKNIGSKDSETGYAITMDGTGKMYLAGFFDGDSLKFGTQTVYNHSNMSSSSKHDLFVACTDTALNTLWARSAGGSMNELLYCMAVNRQGQIFVTGGFDSPYFTFGGDSIFYPSWGGSLDPMYILTYDMNGNELCASAIGSGGDDNCGLSCGKNGSVYMCGDFISHFIIENDTIFSPGQSGEYIFLAKYSCEMGIGPISVFDEKNPEEKVSVYPNPTNNKVFINGIEELDEICIYNLFGEIVLKHNPTKNRTAYVDIGDLINGVYLVKLKTIKGIFTKRIIVQH